MPYWIELLIYGLIIFGFVCLVVVSRGYFMGWYIEPLLDGLGYGHDVTVESLPSHEFFSLPIMAIVLFYFFLFFEWLVRVPKFVLVFLWEEFGEVYERSYLYGKRKHMSDRWRL